MGRSAFRPTGRLPAVPLPGAKKDRESKPMRVGVPREIKSDEYRVGMMPVGAEALVKAGHEVLVEAGAGAASGFPDEAYAAAGARVVPAHEEVFARADVIVKV